MREIGATEARNKLGQLLDLAEAGKEFVIRRRSRVVARLVPPQPAVDPKKSHTAAAAIPRHEQGCHAWPTEAQGPDGRRTVWLIV